MLKKIKSYMMPIAMAIGCIFYQHLKELSFTTPYLIAIMLLLTYSNISLKNIRFTPLHYWLLGIQIIGSILIYILIYPFDVVVAQGAMICVLTPTATSAIVVTSMLGGNASSLTAFSLLSNITVAFTAPILFAIIGKNDQISFWEALLSISQRVFIILLSPLLVVIILKRITPALHQKIQQAKGLSFYLWSMALMIVTARTVYFISQQDSSHYNTEIIIALCALVLCIAQFATGRALGRRYQNTIAGGQGLGQKNTILGIWMAQTYLDPISSIGSGAYVLWQNIVNSYQVWRKRKDLK